jgi:hypothetical protein
MNSGEKQDCKFRSRCIRRNCDNMSINLSIILTVNYKIGLCQSLQLLATEAWIQSQDGSCGVSSG